MIVWCLFDDANGSWNKYSKEQNENTFISIGINNNDWDNYYQIDLSIQNESLINKLNELPKPDIIVASPPCESWSIADNQQRLWREQKGNNIKVHLKSDIEHNNKVMHAKRKRDYYKQWRTTLNGISTTLGLLKVIEHFKPLIWVIENPETSKIWEFINENVGLNGFRNKTYYNAYDINFTKKPTIFFSNVKLDLRLNHIKQLRKWEETQGYALRSSIPKDLLKDIIEQITKKGVKTMKELAKVKQQSVEQLDLLNKIIQEELKSNEIEKDKAKPKKMSIDTLLNFYNQVFQRIYSIQAMELQVEKENKK